MSAYAGSSLTSTEQYPMMVLPSVNTYPPPFAMSFLITAGLGYPSCHCSLPSAFLLAIAPCRIFHMVCISSFGAFLNCNFMRKVSFCSSLYGNSFCAFQFPRHSLLRLFSIIPMNCFPSSDKSLFSRYLQRTASPPLALCASIISNDFCFHPPTKLFLFRHSAAAHTPVIPDEDSATVILDGAQRRSGFPPLRRQPLLTFQNPDVRMVEVVPRGSRIFTPRKAP